MKLGRQGELSVKGDSTALIFESSPTEINTSEGKRPFIGQVLVQPHSLKLIWEVLEGKRNRVTIRSGDKILIVKYQPEKNRVRFRFLKEDEDSSYILFGSALNRFKDLFLDAIKDMQVVTIRNGDFVATRAGDKYILRNGKLEYYIDSENAERLKQFILKNYLLKEPLPVSGKISIDEEKNLKYKGLVIPKESVKDLYLFIL